MHTLFILYSALAVFGIGVTIVDMFGVFDQAVTGGENGAGSGSDGSDGGDGGDGGSDGGSGSSGSAGDADTTTGDAEAAAMDVAGQSNDAIDGRADESADLADLAGDTVARGVHDVSGRGSLIGSGDAGARLVARIITAMRLGVHFSLGAGPTGLFAVATGVPAGASLVWSAGAGLFIAILARTLRSFMRRDLDSTIKPEEFLMDRAVITVSVTPGAMGKALVRRYQRETELYVRCVDPDLALAKGREVRIVDLDGEAYLVEPL